MKVILRNSDKILVALLGLQLLMSIFNVVRLGVMLSFEDEAVACTIDSVNALDESRYKEYLECISTEWSFIPTNTACECLDKVKENK